MPFPPNSITLSASNRYMKKLLLSSLLSFVLLAAVAQLKENVGIGVRLQLDSSKGYTIPVILALIPDGAAEKAGLQVADIIIKVDGKSTKDMLLKDVVAMITGEAGTNVRLDVLRKGAASNFIIMRGKYKYSAAFYEAAIKDNELCNALTKLMNDAGYDFVNTLDNNATDINGDYVSKVKIPGAQTTGITRSLGAYCAADMGNFSSKDEVNAKGTDLMNKVKTCFPDYYYEPEVGKNGTISVSIGRKFTDGYEGPILQFFTYEDKTTHKQKLQLRVNGGKLSRYYSIDTKAADNSFTKALRTIYNDVTNDYSHVKGKKHETDGGVFSSLSSWYEIQPVPDGAKTCSLTEGSINISSNNCNCGFYQGSDRTAAVNTFNNLYDKMVASLGSDFVYSWDRSQWDMHITKNAETAITFAIKKKKDFESNLPRMVLLFEKYENDTYGVRIIYYQFGF